MALCICFIGYLELIIMIIDNVNLDSKHIDAIHQNLGGLINAYSGIVIDDIDILNKKIYAHFFNMPQDKIKNQIFIELEPDIQLFYLKENMEAVDISLLVLEEDVEYVLLISTDAKIIVIVKAEDYFEEIDDAEILD